MSVSDFSVHIEEPVILNQRRIFQTRSAAETRRSGKILGRLLPPGSVVGLVGELGAGKTQFIKGLAAGVGVKRSDYVTSPSFTLVNEYPGQIPFYHIDLYRLGDEKEAEDLGLEVYARGHGVTAIEWADKILSLLPEELLWVHMEYAGIRDRKITFLPQGKRYEAILNQWVARARRLGSGRETR